MGDEVKSLVIEGVFSNEGHVLATVEHLVVEEGCFGLAVVFLEEG